jgi:hypothetical protein
MKEIIRKIVRWGEKEVHASDKEAELSNQLNELLTLGNDLEYPEDVKECPQPPENSPIPIVKNVTLNFPSFDMYIYHGGTNHPTDDLFDIVNEMMDVEWYLENASQEKANWYFKFSFDNHWGEHAKGLLWYLTNT